MYVCLRWRGQIEKSVRPELESDHRAIEATDLVRRLLDSQPANAQIKERQGTPAPFFISLKSSDSS